MQPITGATFAHDLTGVPPNETMKQRIFLAIAVEPLLGHVKIKFLYSDSVRSV